MKKRTKRIFEEQRKHIGQTCGKCGQILKEKDLGNIVNYVYNEFPFGYIPGHYKCPMRPKK